MKISRIFVRNILILSVLASLGCGIQKNDEKRSTEAADRQINQSVKLKKLDKICRDLPVFEDYEPEIKTIGRKDDILFYYYKIKIDAAVLQNLIKDRLPENGWEFQGEQNGNFRNQLEFEKDNYWLRISYNEFTELNYSINCKDLSASK